MRALIQILSPLTIFETFLFSHRFSHRESCHPPSSPKEKISPKVEAVGEGTEEKLLNICTNPSLFFSPYILFVSFDLQALSSFYFVCDVQTRLIASREQPLVLNLIDW